MNVINSKNNLHEFSEFSEQLSTQLLGNRSYCKRNPCTAAGDQVATSNVAKKSNSSQICTLNCDNFFPY